MGFLLPILLGYTFDGFPYGLRAAKAAPPSAYPSTADGGAKPLENPPKTKLSVPRFKSGGVEQILRDASVPRLRAEYFADAVLSWRSAFLVG